ncbi:MAG: Peptide deformylase [Chlamydiia bacterium]|nr:Peptide deformylase [Chlamydiia bacterium]
MTFNQSGYSNPQKLVTIYGKDHDVLKQKTEDIKLNELALANEISDKLTATLASLNHGAGLAAPQIGISRSVFIYSYDRTPENLETVINPTLKPVGNEIVKGWEACFSSIMGGGFKAAYIPRYEVIDVTYTNLQGEKIEKRLDGFASKVFQHEYDHLQGTICVNHPDAISKEFPNKEAFMEFMIEVREDDFKRYNKP